MNRWVLTIEEHKDSTIATTELAEQLKNQRETKREENKMNQNGFGHEQTRTNRAMKTMGRTKDEKDEARQNNQA